MSARSPFIQDRAIPLYPGLALFLDYLPGVDDRLPRNKKAKSISRQKRNKAGEVIGVKASYRGMQRALVLTQLDHVLRDSAPTDRRLFIRGTVTWYARSYREWHNMDFPFMPFSTMVKAFQDLIDGGYIMARSETAFVAPDAQIADRKALMRILGSYNGKAFSIDYPKLERAMTAHTGVQAYFADRFRARSEPPAPKEGSDQGDQTRDQGDQTRDQGDQTPAIRVIAIPDQGDQTPAIRVIAIPDQGDQTRSDVNQSLDQTRSESSSDQAPAGLIEDSQTSDDRTEKPFKLPLGYTKSYGMLTRYGIGKKRAEQLALIASPDRIEAWMQDIDGRREAGTLEGTGTGYLKTMLEQEGAWPPGHKRKEYSQTDPEYYDEPNMANPPSGKRFLSGKYAGEINS
jgi:hypothetical protein